MKIATYKLTNLGAGNHILRAKATDGTLVSAFSNVISYSRVAVHTAVLNCSANAPTAVSIGKSLTASFLTHGGDYANYTFATGTILVKMDDGTGTLQDITSTAWSYGTGSDGREIGIVQIENVTGTVYISVTAGAVEQQIPTDSILFAGETSNFTLKATYKEWNGTVEYSTDKNTWNTWNGSEISSANKKLYLRGKNNTKFYTSKGVRFVLSAKAGCYGNINTLLDYKNPPTTLASSCYRSMFRGCTSLTTAPTLPATTLATYCYYQMFYGCTKLVSAPALPATTLKKFCYWSMFQGCTSLTSAPELPATTLAESCYQSMFRDCTSLTTAPALPDTTLEYYCYNGMFSGCTSLTSAPALPATTLAHFCYSSMFQGCTSLTTAPELPATTLTDGCYSGMLQGCTSLTTAPELPATTLGESCYRDMFSGCTSLTSAPALPATTLANYCYQRMFQDCTSLKVSETQTEEYATAWRIPSTGEIAAEASDWNRDMLKNTGGTFTANPSINTTYYIAG